MKTQEEIVHKFAIECFAAAIRYSNDPDNTGIERIKELITLAIDEHLGLKLMREAVLEMRAGRLPATACLLVLEMNLFPVKPGESAIYHAREILAPK